ncbi:MAG: cryptochrome/photolyase family protein [Saccharospirillum sp.]
MTHLVWYRNDCRVSDHQALFEACANADPGSVQAIFLWTPEQWARHDYGPARQYSWLQALKALEASLNRLGIPLTLLQADTWSNGVRKMVQWASEQGIRRLSFHREFGWDEVQRDRLAVELAQAAGLKTTVYEDRIAFDPQHLLTGQNDMYRVFTPYKKRWLSQWRQTPLAPPLPAPKAIGDVLSPSVTFPGVHWQGTATLPLTEPEAHEQLNRFSQQMRDYQALRDQPAVEGTSRLSAALANGAISLRQCLHQAFSHDQADSQGVQTWISELIWRDFYHYLLYWRPELAKHQPFYPKWDAFPWDRDSEALSRWQQGTTGVPIVDAGMRQLTATGWMHNRVRMIVAMYLVKLLQQDWRAGERWFAQQLLDIDFASNNGGWQWCASTGVDAAPYFRIFNPYTQAERFDPQSDYIRQWVPELAGLDAKAARLPDAATAKRLDYPVPMIDYKQARANTLAAFKQL